jgi:hypothetical protein
VVTTHKGIHSIGGRVHDSNRVRRDGALSKTRARPTDSGYLLAGDTRVSLWTFRGWTTEWKHRMLLFRSYTLCNARVSASVIVSSDRIGEWETCAILKEVRVQLERP